MTKKIEQMITKIIRKYGFEHEKTIQFCKYVEMYPMELLQKIYEAFMEEEV